MLKANMFGSMLIGMGMFFCSIQAAELSAIQKTKIDAQIAIYKAWSTDPEIVKAVKEYNATPPAEYKGMTNDKWKALTIMSPEVRGLTKNTLALYIKGKKSEAVTEGFISGADGTKVAFLSKTTNWTHKGKPKHDVPMIGKIWIGDVEVDESTGIQSVQVGFPVLDAGKAIGSIVLGFSIAKL